MTAHFPPPGFGVSFQQSPKQPQADQIKRLKDRRVSWANGENLCQIRLFVAEDAPAMSGSVQEQLQPKQARNLHIYNSPISSPASDAPPGFGGVSDKPKPDYFALAAIVPQISWRAPSMVYLDPTWHVMAGGASLEIGLQTNREVRMLEAVYPRPSSIPESPAEPVEAQEPYDDSITPQIPLVPLEEEDPPDGNDPSISLGPRFQAHGSSGQGMYGSLAGVQSSLGNASGLSNDKPEKVNQQIGDSLPGVKQQNSLPQKEYGWQDASAAVFTARPSTVFTARSFMDHSSNLMNGRPPPASPLSDVHTNSKHSGVQPNLAAATAAAFAALAKSHEVGSMIDNELLIQVLSDPSLLQSLTFKLPFTPPNPQSELSSLTLNGVSRGPDKLNQAQVNNMVTGSNHWINPPSTSYMRAPGGGQEGNGSRSGESYSIAGEKFLRSAVSNERPTLLPGSIGNVQLYTDPTNGRVGSGILPRPSVRSESPPGFGCKSAAEQGAQIVVAPQVGAAPARPLSRVDEQYYKNLIMQHGCKSADDDDHGRAGKNNNKGNSGANPPITYSTPAAKRWYDGRDELDGERSERIGRDRRDNERIGLGPAFEFVTRAKSRKVCIYFGTQRGCRNGENCTFVHELSESEKTKSERVLSGPTHIQYAKRLKVDG